MGAWLSSLANNLWDQGVIAPELGQAAQLPGSAPQNITILPQAPDPSATNATNGTPGSLKVTLAAPVNGGAQPFFEIAALATGSSNPIFYMGYDASIGAGALWVLPYYVNPGGGNFAVGTSVSGDTLINSGGNVYVQQNGYQTAAVFNGSTGNTQFGTSTQWGGGTGVIGISNATGNPSSTPSGGGVLYATAGALHWLGSSGHDTLVAAADPYCPVCGLDAVNEHRWSTGPNAGKYFSLCYNCLADHLGNPAFVLRDAKHRESRKGWRKPLRATHKHYAFAIFAAALATLISHFWR